MFYELFINHILGLYEPQPIIKLILYFGIEPTIKGIKFLRINHLSYILFFHAAKVRKILVTSKCLGRNLLLFCFTFEKGITLLVIRSLIATLTHQVDSGGAKRRAKKRECSGTQMDKIKTATRCSSFYSHTN